MNDKIRGIGALVLAAVLFGTVGVFSRFIGSDIPIFYQQFVRYVLTLVILAVVVIQRHQWKRVQARDWGWIVIRGLGGFLGFVAVYIAFLYLDFGTNYFVASAATAITGYALGKILFREKITKLILICLVMALTGLYLVYSANLEISKLPFLALSFLSGIGGAIWNVVSKKISSTYSNSQVVFLDVVIDAIAALVISLVLVERWVAPSLDTAWFALGALTIALIGANIFVVYGFKSVEANLGSLVLLLDIVAALIFGALLFSEIPSPLSFAGGLLIVTAISLPSLAAIASKRKKGGYDAGGEHALAEPGD